MRIHNDGPGRIVIVAAEEPEGVEPFDPSTKLGHFLETLLGEPARTWFATAAVLPPVSRRSMSRHVYGYDARDELADRCAIVVGKEAAMLLDVPADPLMIWCAVRWKFVGAPGFPRERVIPSLMMAAFPSPGARSTWWRDQENVEVAKQWLMEQGQGGAR